MNKQLLDETVFRLALVFALLGGSAVPHPAVAAQQVAATNLALPVLGLSVAVGGRATWTATAQTMGSARVDQVTGQLDGLTFTVVIRTGPAGRCGAVINDLQARNNARVVQNASYAPPVLEDPVVEAPSGDAVFCMPVGERSALFILRPGSMTSSQREAVRLLALATMVAGIGTETAAAPGPSASGANGVIQLLWVGLTIPVEPGSRWGYSEVIARGFPQDAVTQPGSAGEVLSIRFYRASAGESCQAALASSGGGQIITRPPWLDSLWHTSVAVRSAVTTAACLPTRDRHIVAEVAPVRNDEDARRVRVLLAGLRAAAHSRWGAP